MQLQANFPSVIIIEFILSYNQFCFIVILYKKKTTTSNGRGHNISSYLWLTLGVCAFVRASVEREVKTADHINGDHTYVKL